MFIYARINVFIYLCYTQLNALEPKDALLYFYYGGMVYLGLKNYKKAFDFLIMVTTVTTKKEKKKDQGRKIFNKKKKKRKKIYTRQNE